MERALAYQAGDSSGQQEAPEAKCPNRFWESGISYVWCGADGWGYCFNVIDVFTRQWLTFVLVSCATVP